MVSRRTPTSGELAGWKIWGLPVFAAVFSPWQEKITSMTLISEYFQPTLNIAASVLGPLTCMVGYMVLNGATKRSKKSVAISSLIVFFLLLLACLLTKLFLQSAVFLSETSTKIA